MQAGLLGGRRRALERKIAKRVVKSILRLPASNRERKYCILKLAWSLEHSSATPPVHIVSGMTHALF